MTHGTLDTDTGHIQVHLGTGLCISVCARRKIGEGGDGVSSATKLW